MSGYGTLRILNMRVYPVKEVRGSTTSYPQIFTLSIIIFLWYLFDMISARAVYFGMVSIYAVVGSNSGLPFSLITPM